ncbi:MAG: hypothetical protein H0W44_09925 [Gammaproteobacteria bacterium]|nr:hypothetical protein [Gammaproteobacteria bacterium]
MKNLVLGMLLMPCLLWASDPQLSEQFITESIIQESIANYPRKCPCPYNLASNGAKCGRRSAYTRQNGYAPLCYSKDVTPAMIQGWKKRHLTNKPIQ